VQIGAAIELINEEIKEIFHPKESSSLMSSVFDSIISAAQEPRPH
jgi:hypothetical protein